MKIPIKTIEHVSIKDTSNSAYLFIDASDNMLKMKIKGKFYSFNLTNEPSITGKPDLIASGFSENHYSNQNLIKTNEFNGTWIYTQQDNGEDMWVHESGKYQLRLPSYSGAYNYPVWHVFSVNNPGAGEFFEMDQDHGSAYSSPTEVKQWSSQLANLTGKFEEKSPSNIDIPGSTIEVDQSLLGVVFEVNATGECQHSNIPDLFVKVDDETFVNIYDENLRIIYFPNDSDEMWTDCPEPTPLANKFVLKNVETNQIYGFSDNSSPNILDFRQEQPYNLPGFNGGWFIIRPIYKNYEIKWDGTNDQFVGKYTYDNEEKKWLKINEDGSLSSSLYLRIYNGFFNDWYQTCVFMVAYNNETPMYATFFGEVPDNGEEGAFGNYNGLMNVTVTNGIKMNGYYDIESWGWNTYQGLGVNVQNSYPGDINTVDCPSLYFEDVNVTHKKSE
jgi:hypothetical protein